MINSLSPSPSHLLNDSAEIVAIFALDNSGTRCINGGAILFHIIILIIIIKINMMMIIIMIVIVHVPVNDIALFLP